MRYYYTAAAVAASIFFSAILLLTDAELWAVAPTHGYVLIVFTLLDGLVLVSALKGRRFVIRYGVLYGLIKLALFLGDILTAPEFGLSYLEFAQYLFGLWAYNGLLAAQLAIVLSTYIDRAKAS